MQRESTGRVGPLAHAGIGRRSVLGSGLAGLAVASLAGCSRFGGGSGGSGDDAVNMVWWGDATRAGVTEDALDLFREETGIEVTTEFQSGDAYDDKIAVRFAGGNPPDLLATRRETLRDFADRGSLLALPVGDGIDVSDIVPSVLAAGAVGDEQYGIPSGVASFAWVVNADVYEQHGVAAPDMDAWSWEDLRDAAAEVTDASGGEVWGAEFPPGDLPGMGIWLRQRGGDLWTPDGRLGFTADDVTEWFELWVGLRDAGAIPDAGEIEPLGVAAEQTSLARGLVASCPFPSNSLAVYQDAIDGTLSMGFYPGETQGERRGLQLVPGGHWSISADTEAPDAAVQLLDFLTSSVEANKAMGATRGTAIKTSVAGAVAETLGEGDRVSFDYTIALGELELVDPIPDPLGSAEILAALGSASEKMMFGESTPAAAAREFLGQAQSIIDG